MSHALEAAFRPLEITATRIGVSAAWLRAEAEAGRIPHLRAGRRMLFDVDAVVRTLRERAQAAAISTARTDESLYSPHGSRDPGAACAKRQAGGRDAH
jgi:hypothetical protein